jgi:hypothetical protein
VNCRRDAIPDFPLLAQRVLMSLAFAVIDPHPADGVLGDRTLRRAPLPPLRTTILPHREGARVAVAMFHQFRANPPKKGGAFYWAGHLVGGALRGNADCEN